MLRTHASNNEEIRGAHFEYQNRLRLSGMYASPRVASSPKWNEIPFHCIQLTDANTQTHPNIFTRRPNICERHHFNGAREQPNIAQIQW